MDAVTYFSRLLDDMYTSMNHPESILYRGSDRNYGKPVIDSAHPQLYRPQEGLVVEMKGDTAVRPRAFLSNTQLVEPPPGLSDTDAC